MMMSHILLSYSMDDNGQNGNGGPVFETVPIEQPPANQAQPEQEQLMPEELAPTIEGENQAEATQLQPEVVPIEAEPQAVYKEHNSKLPIIAGAVVVFIIVFIGILFALLGGNKAKKVTPKQITLSYWGLWEEKEVMDVLINEYQRNNPGVRIQYEKKSPQDYRQKLLTWSQKGQGPDIFRFHNTWLPQIQDVVAPLSETVMTGAEFERTFYPIHAKDLKIGRGIYGMPLMVDSMVLLVNEDLLKKAGISTPPNDWDELISTATQVTVKTKEGELVTAGIALGTANNIEHFSEVFGLMLLLNGGDVAALNSAEAIGALEAYRRFAEEPNNVWSDLMPNSITAFMEGKVAMIFAPTWELYTIKATAPQMKISVLPIPAPPGSSQLSLASYWVEGVSRVSSHQEEAWKFLKYLASKDGQTKMFEIQSTIRPFGTAYARQDLAELLVQDDVLGPVVKMASEDKLLSLPLVSRTFDDGLNDEIVRYVENAINASAQGVSYKEALLTAQKGIDQVLQRYKIE